MIERAKTKGVHQIVANAWTKQQAGQAFLDVCGFMPAGHNRFMKAPAATPIATPIFPAGFVLRSYSELDDIAALVAGSNGCYADMWGHREYTEPATIARFHAAIARSPEEYPPEGIFVIFAQNGEIAGICFNRVEGEEQKKVLDSPGIVPAYRHLGLHRPLVQASMYWLNTQADGMFHLDTWGDFTEAVLVYAELGFTLDEANHLIEYLLITPAPVQP